MFLAIPAKGADAIARLDAEPRQRRGELARTLSNLFKRRAARGGAVEGDHFLVRKDRCAMLEDRVHGERVVLHRALHEGESFPPCLRLALALRLAVFTFSARAASRER